jgi:UDP-N-acetylglucosamine/UDP-N-acetylgalactosamine diphosphorylase
MIRGRNDGEQSKIEEAISNGQEHLFRFWDELDELGKAHLIEDMMKIDFGFVQRAKPLLGEKTPLRRTVRKPNVITIHRSEDEKQKEKKAAGQGNAAIAKAKVAVFTAAGGQSSRLGLEAPKGTYPVSPIREKSLFQVHAEKIVYVQDKFGVKIPWVIMVSETNRDETDQFFRANDFFGLTEEYVRFIEQGMFPAMNGDGKIILSEPDRIFLNPTGHGGTFNALKRSGTLNWLEELGVEEIFYFQVDNVLVKILDPVFIGYHLHDGCEMSSKCVMKRDANEKIGVFVIEGGAPTVVEYTELASIDLEDGGDTEQLWAGNIAIHLINRQFAQQGIGGIQDFPLHVAHKAIPLVNDRGEKRKPDKPNGYKIETFIFDALKYTKHSVIMEAARLEEFSPLKNRSGEDCPETVFRDQLRLFAAWFEDAGITVLRDEKGEPRYRLEVSPLFAAFKWDFIEKIDKNTVVDGDTYIE